MQPTVSEENNDYTFTLWRDGKQVVHTFKDACVILSYGTEKSIPAAQLAKMNGPSYNGWTYHIYVQQHHADKNTEDIFIWLSKEEFYTLSPMLDIIDITRGKYDETECAYCSNSVSSCKCDDRDYSDDLRSEMLIKRGY
jgi:hypothetical protein